jgi:hypothetical protein
MTDTQKAILEAIEASRSREPDGSQPVQVRPDRATIDANTLGYVEGQLLALVQDLSTDRAFYQPSPDFPHEYVKSIMGRLNGIRRDLRTRQGTPGFGVLRGAA